MDDGITTEIDPDHLCPVCQLLLFDPVKTTCGHRLCKTCMATWAEVSVSSHMDIVSVDEQPRNFDTATGLEAKCPMCRTQASATLDFDMADLLKSKYHQKYAERGTEADEAEPSRESIQSMTICIGNRHEIVQAPDGSPNSHQWTFFVRPSRTDVIEEVHIFLHPTFRPPKIVRQRSPYEVRRLGWGVFPIIAAIILRAGNSWVSSDAEDSPDGARNGMLQMEWMLDFTSFDGKGSMGRCRLKVKNDRDWTNVSDEEAEEEAEWSRVVRQYQQDGRYEPPPED
jgi:hypothetical protein